jgi:DNA-directed RNA polymerase sigma subunit (sigma70/sigma32)
VWETEELLWTLWELVARLPDRLRIVIVARYGLTGQGRAFYPRIGCLLGVSHERARQLHTEALLWLRHPAHSQQLRSLLGRHTLADYEAVEAEIQRWLQWRGGRDED